MSPTSLVSAELRDAALSATRRGWPITPGTFLGTDRRWHGRDGAARLDPISDTWQDTPVVALGQVQEIWSERPYSVLLACGRGVDVLDLPYRLGGLLPSPEVPWVPVATTSPPRRWLLFTATSSGKLFGELDQAGVRLHGMGAWVPLPPTAIEFLIPLRWLESPQHPGVGRLRTADEMQDALLTALWHSGPPGGRVITMRPNPGVSRRATLIPRPRAPAD